MEYSIQKLMPHAMKGDFERYLADASIFMEFFSLIIVGWSWLEIGVATRHAIGIFIASILHYSLGVDEDVAYPGTIFLMAGIGLLFKISLTKQLAKQN